MADSETLQELREKYEATVRARKAAFDKVTRLQDELNQAKVDLDHAVSDRNMADTRYTAALEGR